MRQTGDTAQGHPMSRPPDSAQAARLRQLALLARIKADRETARLGETARARGRIVATIAALGQGEAPLAPVAAGAEGDGDGDGRADPAGRSAPSPPPDHGAGTAPGAPARPLSPLIIRARLAHRAWVEARRAELQMRLARIEADWLRLRPKAVQAFGRAEVLEDLAQAADRQVRQQARERRDAAIGSPIAAPVQRA